MRAVQVILGAAIVTTASAQTVTAVTPDVISVGSAAVPVTLRGRGLLAGGVVRLQDCTGDTVRVTIVRTTHLSVTIPPRMLRSPCVLRLRAAESMQEVPLAVADPAILALPVPAALDQDAVRPWHGEFNRECEEDSTTTPVFQADVAVYADSQVPAQFVLGKGRRAVMRVRTVAPKVHAADATQQCWYVVLPGVVPDDVRQGPDDVESFWIGVLAEDGKSIHDVQWLSDMVPGG